MRKKIPTHAKYIIIFLIKLYRPSLNFEYIFELALTCNHPPPTMKY